MPPEASSASTTSLPEGDDYIRFALARVNRQLYPAVHGIVKAWLADDVKDLYALRRNGAGVQIVFAYPSTVYEETLKLYVETFHRRESMDRHERRAVSTVLVATGLINLSMLPYLFGVGRSTTQSWKVPRPENFPLKRLGGELPVGASVPLLNWWKARMEYPESAHGGHIKEAIAAGASWPVVARFTERTVAAAKKAKETSEKGPELVVTVDHRSAAREAVANPGGRAEDSRQSGAEHDFAGFTDEPQFSLVPAPVDGGDAYKSAADLLAQHEADAGDAGHADAPETGFFEGFEVDRREREGGADRGTHPFLQP